MSEEYERAMDHLGECKIHNILYVEIDPTNKKGCPICNKEKEATIKLKRGIEPSFTILDEVPPESYE